ncbi:hypothetical protein GH714_001482 [Hevea brasiliensis]|uniref:CCHC-type domain-containing protein n=1 Tax=Hevea brasiliensis TaxID=3981 RepID=A0A6A6N693_HEVBR|nr:hypothetical protein GH714_001482 [Hevea brasiliensis]
MYNRLFMRIKVEIAVNKPLIESFTNKRRDGSVERVRLRYERLPDVCYMCGLLGHQIQTCPNIAKVVAPENRGKRQEYGHWMRTEIWITKKSQSLGGESSSTNQNELANQSSILVTKRWIDVAITHNVQWHATFVYGDPEANNRIEFINALKKLNFKDGRLWMLMGDFNICNSPLDKWGRRRINNQTAAAYNSFLDNDELGEIDFKGPTLFWIMMSLGRLISKVQGLLSPTSNKGEDPAPIIDTRAASVVYASMCLQSLDIHITFWAYIKRSPFGVALHMSMTSIFNCSWADKVIKEPKMLALVSGCQSLFYAPKMLALSIRSVLRVHEDIA